uniref:Uncharacterized protein n=1 Tax=viral metagenome TaxID=1070528 RepID=A0A6C0DXQ1_9ZZZZ
MAFASNITLTLVLMFVLILSGYLISAFFDLEIQYYMPYILWMLGLCTFNLFLNKEHINIYSDKIGTETVTSTNKMPADAGASLAPTSDVS